MRAGALVLVIALASCGGGGTESVTGVIIDLDGDLTSVASFTLRTPDGDDLVFEPAPGATFHGGPLPHLRDHLRSGSAVRVEYRRSEDGLVAVEVDDG